MLLGLCRVSCGALRSRFVEGRGGVQFGEPFKLLALESCMAFSDRILYLWLDSRRCEKLFQLRNIEV
jgi:hypothetical protein